MSDIWFGTEGPRDAKIAIVSECWGREEFAKSRPFAGGSGALLNGMLADAGINRADCFITNIVPAIPPRGKNGRPETKMFFIPTTEAKNARSPIRGLYPGDEIQRGLSNLHSQLREVRPDLIIALGNYALWALVDDPSFGVGNDEGRKIPTGITVWRGSQHLRYNTGLDSANQPPVIPTFHPAAILNDYPSRQPAVHDLRVRTKLANPPEYQLYVRPNFEEVLDILHHLQSLPSGSWLSRDYETAAGHADCLGIAWSANDALCIPFCDLSNGASYWSLGQESEIRCQIATLFARQDLHWSGQNANYEAQYEAKWFDATTDFAHDTMIAHHLLWPGTPMDLTYLSSLYCSYHRYWGEANWWERTGNIEDRWRYNCEDACRTWEIAQVLESVIDTMGFRLQFRERMDVARANLDLMLRGIRIDVEERKRQALQVFMGMQEMEADFTRLMPECLSSLVRTKSSKSPWYRSPTQLGALLYDLLGQPEHRNKKTKARTTDDDALQKISAHEPLLDDLCTSILAYRSMGVYYNNFLTAALDPDGRMRCSIGEGPITFRMRSGENAFGRGTNLQNIPKEKDE